MRWNIGFFGVKDIFTIINLLGGVGGIYFALKGNVEYAGYSIFAGYVFGDALDGPVARATRTSNKFGREFDSAADHLAQGIAPAVIVYAAFAHAGYEYLGLGLMGLFMTTATMRQAKFNVHPFNYPLTYCGLPRTISGLAAISLPNSTLYFKEGYFGYEGVAVILAGIAIMNLVPVPYVTHTGRKLSPILKPVIAFFLLSPLVLVVVAPAFAYDVLFFSCGCYIVGGWIPVRPEERREFRVEYKRWAQQVAMLR